MIELRCELQLLGFDPIADQSDAQLALSAIINTFDSMIGVPNAVTAIWLKRVP